MEFTVYLNDGKETEYYRAPGEIFLFSQYGQLFIENEIDHSVSVIPKVGKLIIVFENPDELPLGATIRLIY